MSATIRSMSVHATCKAKCWKPFIQNHNEHFRIIIFNPKSSFQRLCKIYLHINPHEMSMSQSRGIFIHIHESAKGFSQIFHGLSIPQLNGKVMRLYPNHSLCEFRKHQFEVWLLGYELQHEALNGPRPSEEKLLFCLLFSHLINIYPFSISKM